MIFFTVAVAKLTIDYFWDLGRNTIGFSRFPCIKGGRHYRPGFNQFTRSRSDWFRILRWFRYRINDCHNKCYAPHKSQGSKIAFFTIFLFHEYLNRDPFKAIANDTLFQPYINYMGCRYPIQEEVELPLRDESYLKFKTLVICQKCSWCVLALLQVLSNYRTAMYHLFKS